jgi:hypothetical protein
MDHARDLLQLINLKRAEMPRPLVGIGHSMGGTNLYVSSQPYLEIGDRGYMEMLIVHQE